VLFAALGGNLLGSLGLPPDERPHLGKLLMVLLNVFCLYCTIGGLSWLISSFSERRGRALTILFLIILALFLLNYLAEFWKPLERIVFLSPLHYHRPVEILIAGVWPWHDLIVLLSAGAGMWLAAGVIFSRRDLATT
jgi:ABC-type transport system involved in multi-copper enzyme maturation permease subunit